MILLLIAVSSSAQPTLESMFLLLLPLASLATSDLSTTPSLEAANARPDTTVLSKPPQPMSHLEPHNAIHALLLFVSLATKPPQLFATAVLPEPQSTTQVFALV